MIRIAPSILSCDFMSIKEDLAHFAKCENIWFHLDVMDGHFVPNLTFGGPIIRQLATITQIPLDVHLMVANPLFHIEIMKDFGIHHITFHLEAATEEESIKIISLAKKLYPSVGVSIKPKTPLAQLSARIIKMIDLLLVMSVEPGFGGQKFIPETYQRLNEIQQLKVKYNPTMQLQVDGGVSEQNSGELISHGVQNLVAGSYIFKEKACNYIAQVESLRSSQ